MGRSRKSSIGENMVFAFVIRILDVCSGMLLMARSSELHAMAYTALSSDDNAAPDVLAMHAEQCNDYTNATLQWQAAARRYNTDGGWGARAYYAGKTLMNILEKEREERSLDDSWLEKNLEALERAQQGTTFLTTPPILQLLDEMPDIFERITVEQEKMFASVTCDSPPAMQVALANSKNPVWALGTGCTAEGTSSLCRSAMSCSR